MCFSFGSSVISFTPLAGTGNVATKSEKVNRHLPRNADDPRRLAEDARLFYVSATRALVKGQ